MKLWTEKFARFYLVMLVLVFVFSTFTFLLKEVYGLPQSATEICIAVIHSLGAFLIVAVAIEHRTKLSITKRTVVYKNHKDFISNWKF